MAHKTNKLKEKRGMTMVNLIVAFTILLILFTTFVQITIFAQNAVNRANRLTKGANDTIRDFYITESAGTCIYEDGTFHLVYGSDSIGFNTPVYAYRSSDSITTVFSFGEHVVATEPRQ